MKGIKGEREKWVIDLSIVDGRLCFYLRSSNHLKILTRPEKQNKLNPRRLTVLLRRRASKETDLDRCLPSTACTEKMERIMGISTKCKRNHHRPAIECQQFFFPFLIFLPFLKDDNEDDTQHDTTQWCELKRSMMSREWGWGWWMAKEPEKNTVCIAERWEEAEIE